LFKLCVKIPENICVAVSGGADSMAALDFLSQGRRKIMALHYNHSTPFSNKAQKVVEEYCEEKNIPLKISKLELSIPKGQSKEDFWRKSRYNFFESNCNNLPVITCHHLDDLVETWIFTSLHGESKLIPVLRGRYIRPFLLTRKAVFEDWCDRKNVPYVFDPSNDDISYMRNYIRHELVPKVSIVNPGLAKVLRKKVLNNLPNCFNINEINGNIEHELQL
jgi:tRNA(Ile)-lysidine synthase